MKIASAVLLAAVVASGAARQPAPPSLLRSFGATGAAWLLRPLDGRGDPHQAGGDVLDAPILPGSVMKVVTLAAALESGVIEPETARLCRRAVTVDGTRYTCSHPDLKRALTPAEALAHSCNDFFVSLAPRLPRGILDDLRARLGLPPIPPAANYAAALVGLDGPRVTPRALLDMVVRLAGADPEHAVKIAASTRQVLLAGLRGAATYGSAAELGERHIAALAKTGTSPMPGGSLGLLVALIPPDAPTRGLVVVTPGAAGRDAASVAADLIEGRTASEGAKIDVRVGITEANGRVRVQTLGLEDYIARVVAGEGQAAAPPAGQQALAIAARTFALANRHRHRSEGYDFCDTTHCQVLRPATPAAARAAQTTAGRVLVYDLRPRRQPPSPTDPTGTEVASGDGGRPQPQPATIFYSAWCGGRSELASEVWPGAIDYAFEPAQEDEACRDEPGWTSEISAPEIEAALRAAGLRGDRLRDLRIVHRNASGRVARLRADGFTPPEVSGHDFRMAMGRVAGWQRLKSTAFELRRTAAGYRFTGRGFGHGVGLCVIGAGRRAAAGATADDILRFYYPGLRIDRYVAEPEPGGSLRAFDTNVRPERSTAAAAPPADVLLALPAGEESDRALVLQLIRRARDDIAARTGTSPPSAIRVTVHPNADSFGRATGQPWWVSGVSDGTTIDLLPLAVLRQRGQLERSVRHEVAHVLLDRELSRRPLWIREGAAFYFADPSLAAEPPGRTRCPTDEEFLRPLSAGAHRDAYARAEGCFRRQLLEGRSWRDVR